MMRDGRIVSDEPVVHEATGPARAAAAAGSRFPAPGRADHRGSVRVVASWSFALMILAAAAQAISRNKLRSVLTTLGVFIGVAAPARARKDSATSTRSCYSRRWAARGGTGSPPCTASRRLTTLVTRTPEGHPANPPPARPDS
jgi:hypothetical protein